MFCNKCGKQIPDDSSFCPACGTSFNQQIINSQSDLKQKESKKKSNAKGCILAVVIVAVIAIVAVLMWAILSGSETDSSSSNNSPVSSESISTGNSELLVSDNSYFTAKYIKASSVPELNGAFNVFVNIENKSDMTCIYALKDVYIDDTAANFSGSGIPQQALAGKKVNGAFSIFSDQTIENASKLEFKIECMDSNYNEVFSSDTITINLK